MCVERCVLGISLIYKAELKRMLIGYLVKTSIAFQSHSIQVIVSVGARPNIP